ncbi:inositol monophosphatase family protein [Nocardiopsis nanhaiensis]
MRDDGDPALAHRLADLAGDIAMRYAAEGTRATETKSDGSPVTPADLRIERELRARVAWERPRDAFTGEELGVAGPEREGRGLDGPEPALGSSTPSTAPGVSSPASRSGAR